MATESAPPPGEAKPRSDPAAPASWPERARIVSAGVRFAMWWVLLDVCQRARFKPRMLFARFYDSVTSLVDLAMPGRAFLDYGYSGGEVPEPLRAITDSATRTSIWLYHRTATAAGRVDLEGMEVLEVGAGRGGGAAWLARHSAPRRYVAVDLSRRAVRRCGEIHGGITGLSFEVADAQDLPFPDSSFDAVLNVESAHTYPSFEAFMAEVARVLRPGGHLLFADFRPAGRIAALERELVAPPGLELVDLEDITSNVLEALRLTHSVKRESLARLRLPRFLAQRIAYFAGAQDSEKFARFERRADVYVRALVRKA